MPQTQVVKNWNSPAISGVTPDQCVKIAQGVYLHKRTREFILLREELPADIRSEVAKILR